MNKNIVIVVLLIVICIVSWIAFKKEPVTFDNTLYEMQIKRIKSERDSLVNAISKEQERYKNASSVIDSLENLKPKIKYVYIEKYKYIDGANIRTNDSLLRANLGLGK